MDAKLLELLVCPISGAPLAFASEQNELWCLASRLAYPINDGIPSLLPEEARELTQQELETK